MGAVAAPAVAQSPTISGVPILPADHVWNTRIDHLPVDSHSAAYIQSIGPNDPLKADFGAGLYRGAPIGIPFVTVRGTQPLVPIRFQYADESDPGPYPFPPQAPIEGGKLSTGDRHVLVLDVDNKRLYEGYRCVPFNNGRKWLAGSGAVFDMTSNELRPAGWTSADAAGLPLLPGLCRWDEVAAGEIRHALRFTVSQTRAAYVWPARHKASSNTDPNLPPMGQRFRLKANFNTTPFSPETRVILIALQRYGMILADNGSDWYISGVPDDRWNNDHLRELAQIKGSDLEAIDESSLMIDPDSGQARQP
ncbi:hypothetical protein GC163_07260 [bacterium]|nr:hypothetical protein [bacterium]